MKAIVVLYNGVEIAPELLTQIVAQIATASSATSNINVTQLSDNEVGELLAKPTILRISTEGSVEEALEKAIKFIQSKYYSYIHSKDYVGLTMNILTDVQSGTEEGKMIKNSIIALSSSESKKIISLGLPKPVLETIKTIHQSKFL